jgi:hypothetical protein
MTEKIIRIGGASGAWGDSPMGIEQMLKANVHYLMMDYLAEVTMSLLARARMKDPNAGYPPDVVGYLKRALPEIAKQKIKVVTNGGGVNPAGAMKALQAACDEAGVNLKVAMVEGDDLMPRLDELRGTVREAVTGEPLPAKLLTANAYLGALPIAAALDNGADIVVTGRCADSALALGILMHEFGWKADDYDKLAAGSLVGHILECGPQATGGINTDWDTVEGWDDIGYPLAECKADGSFIVTKPEGTGGKVTPPIIAEQVLYEVGDPAAYLLPDVAADFSGVSLKEAGANRVEVTNVRGRPATAQYKVSATYQDGYRAIGMIPIVGPDAAKKAERAAEAIVARVRSQFRARNLGDFSATYVEVLGAESAYGPASRARGSREVVLRLVVDHPDRNALDLFAREFGSAGLSFSPGITGLIGGRPKATPVVRLYTFFIDKAKLAAPRVTVNGVAPFEVPVPTQGGYAPAKASPVAAEPAGSEATVEVPLIKLAYARSGDKGNGSNIAVFARKPEYVALIRREVTPEKMAKHFAHQVHGKVERFEAPGLSGFNFLLEDALGGGGMASRRIDPQGKAFGQMALEMTVPVPKSLAAKLNT